MQWESSSKAVRVLNSWPICPACITSCINTHKVCLTCILYHLSASHLWLCNKRICTIPCVFLTFQVFISLLCALRIKSSHNAVLLTTHIYPDLLGPPFTWVTRVCEMWCDHLWSEQNVTGDFQTEARESFDMIRERWQKEETIVVYKLIWPNYVIFIWANVAIF